MAGRSLPLAPKAPPGGRHLPLAAHTRDIDLEVALPRGISLDPGLAAGVPYTRAANV